MYSNYYQQGDVLIKSVKSIPSGLVPLVSTTLQRGETTGHSHRFAETDQVTLYTTPDRTLNGMRIHTHDGVAYISVIEPATLYHEEHRPITLPPGYYEIDLVREYDYDTEEMRRVED